MKGIVFTGKQAEVVNGLEVRDPGPTEVRVKIVNAGLCHSDVSVINGTIPWPAPSVLGHEGAGIVDAIGSEVGSVKPGDHVVLTTLANCGLCEHCSAGKPTWCRKSLGNMSQPFTLDGEPAWNFAATSVFAEKTVVREIQCVKIEDDVPLSSACLIGCGVVTGVGAVFNRANVQRGQNVAVFGVGGIGLNVIQACRIAGASRIIALDMIAAKEPLALQFGATDFVDVSQTDGAAAVRELLPYSSKHVTGPMGAGGVDWSFECVGHPKVLEGAMSCLDWGGNCVIIGVPPPTAELSTLIGQFTHVDRGLMGSRYGSIRPHKDIPILVDLYRRGQLMLDELVSATYPIEDFDKALADLHDGKLARGVLAF
ncbi:MAG: S-(hydroxymethyl)mycothiol dehydrogenase [Acidimicrobiales bacterium]|jgi:Zn-dependent alcohol dehydrogenase|nr:S-(hydroxymethyl)mycothiol dehydrogenase [Acidimicrobiales bacterium]